MGYLRIVLGVCILFASVTSLAGAGAGGDFSVASLAPKQGQSFEQRDVVFIQQYYSSAPQYFIDDMLKKEKGLPAGFAAAITRGKPLPRELVPFAMSEPASVARSLAPLPRGFDRKVVGRRYLLLDARMVVQDMIHLPAKASSERLK